MNTKYPEIESLYKLKVKHNLTLSIEKKRGSNVGSYLTIKITFLLNKISISIPTFDERDEANPENQLLMLQMILMECIEYETTSDYLVWCKKGGLNASDTKVMKMYDTIKVEVPKLREIIGNDIVIISDWDFEMNEGAAYELRKMS